MMKKTIKKLFLFVSLIFLSIFLSACNNKTNIRLDEQQPNTNNKIIEGKEKNSLKDNNQNIKFGIINNEKEIKKLDKLISILNEEINKLRIKKENLVKLREIEKNTKDQNIKLLSSALETIIKLKQLLEQEKQILKNDLLTSEKKIEKINENFDKIISLYTVLQNNPYFRNNFVLIKDNLENLIKKHYYTQGYFLLLNNNSAKVICKKLDFLGIDSKDNCYYTLSKNYNIDLCLDINNKDLQEKCFIFKKQYLGYKKFKNIKECLKDKDVQTRLFSIEGCFDYFYNKKYEKIISDLKNDPEIKKLINKIYYDNVVLYFVEKYAKVMKDTSICNKFYDSKKEQNKLKTCIKDTIIAIFKETNNIKWLNKIKNKTIKKYLILEYFPNIISYNNIKDVEKNKICEYIKDTNEYQYCKDLEYIEEVRQNFTSRNINDKKVEQGKQICNKISDKKIKKDCYNYLQTIYTIGIGMEKLKDK